MVAWLLGGPRARLRRAVNVPTGEAPPPEPALSLLFLLPCTRTPSSPIYTSPSSFPPSSSSPSSYTPRLPSCECPIFSSAPHQSAPAVVLPASRWPHPLACLPTGHATARKDPCYSSHSRMRLFVAFPSVGGCVYAVLSVPRTLTSLPPHPSLPLPSS